MKKIYDIENSIEKLQEWTKKYPNLTFGRDGKTEIFEDASHKEEYEEMKKLYSYLRTEKSKNHMSDEQIARCKEANIGGVFGYSKNIELTSLVFRCSIKTVLNILAQYGSIEGYYDAYVNHELSNYSNDPCYIDHRVFKTTHEIEMNGNKNYNLLASAISGSLDSRKELAYYKKSKLDELIENVLTEREMKVIKLRFGLEDGKFRDLENVGRRFNVTRERIRQIEAKALRKLRHPKHEAVIKLNLKELNESEIEEIFEANKKLRIFSTSEEETKKANATIKKYIEKQNIRIQEEREQEAKEKANIEEARRLNPNYDFENTSIRDFAYDEKNNISYRLWRCLRISHFQSKKVKDLLNTNISEIRKMRNFGKKTEEELLAVLDSKGYVLDDNGNFKLKEILTTEQQEEKEKEQLLNELLSLFAEQETLKQKLADKDKEIEAKLGVLKEKGITYEKK